MEENNNWLQYNSPYQQSFKNITKGFNASFTNSSINPYGDRGLNFNNIQQPLFTPADEALRLNRINRLSIDKSNNLGNNLGLSSQTSTAVSPKPPGFFKNANSFMKSNSGQLTGNILSSGLDIVNSLGKPLDNVSGASKALNVAGDALGNIPVYGKFIKSATSLITGIDKLTGKDANTQITAGATATGYDLDFNALAGTRYGGLFGRKARKRTNNLTNYQDSQNIQKIAGSYNANQNQIAAQSNTQDYAERNRQKLIGGIDTRQIAKKGAKINPAQLRNLVKKAKRGDKLQKVSFEDWYNTVPKDRNDTTSYNLRRAYEMAPRKELEKWRTATTEQLKDNNYHLKTFYWNKSGVGEFMKSKHHPTIKEELNWYNSNEAKDFRTKYKLYDDGSDYYQYVPIGKFQDGGQLNVIPEGALHARKHELPEELKDKVTHKGIPVITYDEGGDVTQHAEIEVNEIIFTKKATEKMEDFYEKNKNTESQKEKDELAIECGKFLALEIIENTDDKTGLINEI